MKKILITGITGFAGSHLAEYLLSQNESAVSGTFLSEGSIQSVAGVKDKISLTKVDLMSADGVNALIADKKPDVIYHLAALASASKSFANPSQTITNNISAQINLLEAVRTQHLLQTKILIVSSADVYGLVKKEDLPIDEDTPMHPTNPYAVSKIAQDFLGLQYFLTYKMPIIRVRPFNHIGPRQALSFALSDFAKRIVAIEKGQGEPVLKVGNLESKRDFTDVRDMVKAYVAILAKGDIGDVYNAGSGVSHSMQEIVDIMKTKAKVPFTIEKDPALLRPSDNPELVCDARKIMNKTSWKPTITIEQSIEDILNYWRSIPA